jgi:hypothetical protein
MSSSPTPVDEPSPTSAASATVKATEHTVQKVMSSVGKLLSKNEHLHRHSITLAEKAHDLVEKHAPSMLHYLPEKRVSKEFIFLVVALFLLMLFWTIGAGSILIDCACVIYPAYLTLLVIETPDKTDGQQWLAYWMIFGLIKVAERFLWFALRVIPLYTIMKLVFSIWLYHPYSNGATITYALCKPYLIASVRLVDPNFLVTPSMRSDMKMKKKVDEDFDKKRATATETDDITPPPAPSTTETTEQARAKTTDKKSRIDAMYDVDTKEDKGLDGQLKVMIKSIEMEALTSVLVEASVQPPESRSKKGGEGIAYKTPAKMGKKISYNQDIFINPIAALDGYLLLEVKQKSTFNPDPQPLASTKIELKGLKVGDAEKHNLALDGGKVTLNIVTILQTE